VLEVKVLGTQQLIQRLQRTERKIKPEARTAMRTVVLLLEGYVKRNKLSGQVLNVQTGRLRSSITGQIYEYSDEIIGKVGTNVEYGRLWELGGVIPEHEVVPRRAQALHFFYKGAEVFCKRARIPARKVEPRPFLAPSLAENRQRIIQIIGQHIEGAIEG